MTKFLTNCGVTNENFPKKKANVSNLNLLDLIDAMISKYKIHPCLHAIRDNMAKPDNRVFSCKNTFLDHISKKLELKKKKPRKLFK